MSERSAPSASTTPSDDTVNTDVSFQPSLLRRELDDLTSSKAAPLAVGGVILAAAGYPVSATAVVAAAALVRGWETRPGEPAPEADKGKSATNQGTSASDASIVDKKKSD